MTDRPHLDPGGQLPGSRTLADRPAASTDTSTHGRGPAVLTSKALRWLRQRRPRRTSRFGAFRPHHHYWLKDVDNGVMDEATCHYVMLDAPQQITWRTAEWWPSPGGYTTVDYYLGEGRSGTAGSVNDGALIRVPSSDDGLDEYRVDHATSTGVDSRWDAVFGTATYGNLSGHDDQGLTYTSRRPFDRDLEIAGYPVARLWIEIDAEDLDLFIYLEEVVGLRSGYVTEGVLRTSCRAIGTPAWDNLGLPFHPCTRPAIATLAPGVPAGLAITLLRVAKRFRRGARLRMTITCADADYFEPSTTNATLRILRDSHHRSRLAVPCPVE